MVGFAFGIFGIGAHFARPWLGPVCTRRLLSRSRRNCGSVHGHDVILNTCLFSTQRVAHFLQTWVMFNPLATPIEALRSIGLLGQWPNFAALFHLFGAGLVLAVGGAWLFEKSRKGFADVL